jgi:hypothetical protein
MRQGAARRVLMLAAIAIAGAGAVVPGEAAARHKARISAPPHGVMRGPATRRVAVETVRFAGRPVRIVRGGATRRAPRAAWAEHTEILRFGAGAAGRVAIVRGGSIAPPPPRHTAGPPPGVEIVRFADARLSSVTIVRERAAMPAPLGAALFGPADGGELDRIAFAVDGIESRHGADLGMWRAAPDGPQGPMQVSAKAAIDVGGGDRFDLRQNRLLGRAYLAQMFRRYGNWPDALAAYNWGPTSLDTWIAGGRDPAQLPPGVLWYIRRALRDAVVAAAAPW